MFDWVLNTPLTLQEIVEVQRAILNRPTANFYESGHIKEILAELWPIKTRQFVSIGNIVLYMR